MKRLWGSLAAVVLVAWVGFGTGLSGEWSSQVAFAGGDALFSNTLTLHLTFSGWELTSTWDLAAPELSTHTLTFQGSLGLLNYEAGFSFRFTSLELSPLGGAHGWAAEGLEWTGGFLTLELPLGDLTLRLTILHGPEGR
jgi:hypothetical protein